TCTTATRRRRTAPSAILEGVRHIVDTKPDSRSIAMRNKLKPLHEAAACVKDGARLVMSANLRRPPMAFLREIVRRKVRNLRVIGVVGGDLNIDFLVGAGAASIV